jgi:hypothetical protein
MTCDFFMTHLNTSLLHVSNVVLASYSCIQYSTYYSYGCTTCYYGCIATAALHCYSLPARCLLCEDLTADAWAAGLSACFLLLI